MCDFIIQNQERIRSEQCRKETVGGWLRGVETDQLVELVIITSARHTGTTSRVSLLTLFTQWLLLLRLIN